MPPFEHLLLTRFNVRLAWSRINPDSDWLRRRISLFEIFCFPSVRQQTNQNFQWIVFFDRDSPDFLLEKIREYQHYRNFVPVFVSAFNSGVCQEITHEKLAKTTDYVITSRLDNDDAIALDFIEHVHNHFIPEDMTFLNFLYGFRYCSRKLYLQRYTSNSFISLIESTQKENLKTVYCGIPHGRYQEIGKILNIQSKPLWLIALHEENIGNQPKGLRCPVLAMQEDFPHLSSCLDNDENRWMCLLERMAGSFYYKPFYALKDLRKEVRKERKV